MKKQDHTYIYNKVTNLIIQLLEDHKNLKFSVPWVKLTDGLNFNPYTNVTYSGINQLLLSLSADKRGYKLNKWVTLQQANKLGGYVKKGEKASYIAFFNYYYYDNKTGANITAKVKQLIADGKSLENLDYKAVPFLREYPVFNVQQVAELPDSYYHPRETQKLEGPQKDDRAEFIVKASGAKVEYKAQNRAFYSSSEDKITMPERKQFKGTEPFYNNSGKKAPRFN